MPSRFRTAEGKLVTTPILAYPDFNRPFILDTDASDIGIGAVLSQRDEEGRERVVAYASRTLSKAERKYCVTRRELLAVVAFTQHFRPYLLGREFLLRTDPGSLTWLQSFKNLERQLLRWLEKLQELNFTIVHRQGKSHQNAVALSRLPCSQCGRDETKEQLIVAVTSLGQQARSEMRRLQEEDPDIGIVSEAREKMSKPTEDVQKAQNRNVRRLFQLWEQLRIQNGILYRQWESPDGTRSILQLILPKSERDRALQDLHAGATGGHLGEAKVLGKLKETFYWPGHAANVGDWCQTCSACTQRKNPSPKNKARLQPIKVGYPMQLVSTDILGPFPISDNGNSYILVATDYFTRWAEAYPIPDQEAVTVASN